MNMNKFAAFTAGVVVMIILASAVLVPTIDGARMTTTTVSNEGAGWAKFAYYEDSEDYEVALSSDGTTLTMGTQSGTADDMIVWASDAAAVIHNAGSFTLLYEDGDSSAAADLGSSANIASVSGALTITDSSSTEVYTSDAVEWTYTPNAGGSFGFFTSSGATVKDFPTAAAGSFAGAYAYNGLNSLNLSTMAPTYSVTDGVFTTGPWAIPDSNAKATVKELSEKELSEKELSEKELSEVSIKASVNPSPNYTDGDFGFNLSSGDAVIVSYSGAGGNIVFPSTVSDGTNTYTVTKIGDSGGNYTVVNNSAITESTITIPDTVTTIYTYAFKDCSNITGTVVFPSSVTSIGQSVFDGTGITGVVLSPNLTSIGSYAFNHCDIEYLTIPASVTSIAGGAFQNCPMEGLVVLGSPASIGTNAFRQQDPATLYEVLDLGTKFAAGSYGIPADAVVSDEIASLGYIAPVSFSETTAKEGAIYDLMGVIPLLIIASILLAVTSMIIVRRE